MLDPQENSGRKIMKSFNSQNSLESPDRPGKNGGGGRVANRIGGRGELSTVGAASKEGASTLKASQTDDMTGSMETGSDGIPVV